MYWLKTHNTSMATESRLVNLNVKPIMFSSTAIAYLFYWSLIPWQFSPKRGFFLPWSYPAYLQDNSQGLQVRDNILIKLKKGSCCKHLDLTLHLRRFPFGSIFLQGTLSLNTNDWEWLQWQCFVQDLVSPNKETLFQNTDPPVLKTNLAKIFYLQK